MEDPEEMLDEEILNGVALRPRVNSKTDRKKQHLLGSGVFFLKKKKFEVHLIINCVIIKNKPQGPKKGPGIQMHVDRCLHGLCSGSSY